MTLYITRYDERMGPFTLAEVEAQVAAGRIAPTDWAWYDGLPTWVQLKDVPGINLPVAVVPGAPVVVPAGPVERPVAVWIICIFYFACFPFALIGLAFAFALAHGIIPIPVQPAQQHYFASQGIFDYSLTVIALVLNLAWSIQLFRLKKQALYLYMGAIALGVFAMIYNIAMKDWLSAVGAFGLVIAGLTWVLNLALLWYIWYLNRKGTLR